ncbi:MAG: D-alanyl-D-alanine carboxypeptidase/D-alanyl-D-alanine-endopeptidase [Propionibacteriaceae bacterium]
MRLNRFVVAPVIVLVVAGLVAGFLTGAFASVARSGLYATGLLSDGGASTLPPGTLSRPSTPTTSAPQPEPEPRGAPAAVLAPATAGPAPSAKRLSAKVTAVDRSQVKGTFSGSVIDVGTGKTLYAKNASKAYIPASTMKVLTTTAALSILGAQHQFSTTVVAEGKGRIILVGGGDPYLVASRSAADPDRASLSRLAQLTAAQLKKAGHTKVSLGYDTSLFSGPSWHPDWPSNYRDQVTPISALWVNEGRVRGSPGARVANPPKVAADAFAAALRKRGIRVTGVESDVAKKGVAPLAAVKSLPLERIVERLLMVSDNDAAEIVAHQAAIGAGKEGSFAAARQVVKSRLVKLGVWDDSARIRDGSGLSRKNLVPADLMARALRVDLLPTHPELRPVATGLPVAGVEGSLRVRYNLKDTDAARGLVRGKTGTLTGVASVAGYVRSTDGSLLAYAFIANDATEYFATRVWFDRVTTVLSRCGCR